MHQIRTKGKEFGATTGRPRRCGWFDAVVARHAVRVNGCHSIAVTKLDVLDEMETIQICVGYQLGSEVVEEFPSDIDWLTRAQPIYESMPGWRAQTGEASRFEELPDKARRYLKRLEGLLGVSISLVSTGSRREQVFRVQCPASVRGIVNTNLPSA
jgi:adenylosuccinate synthase